MSPMSGRLIWVTRLHLRDDLDRNSNRQPKIAVRAPLIDGDFGQSVRILVPECRAWRPIAEGPLALQYLARRAKLSAGRQHGCPQPSHGIAEMIDVNNLAEVVRPVCAAIRAIFARLAGGRLAARQHGGDRCEQVAPVKAGREALRLPVDVPTARVASTALDQLKQAVARADVPPAVGLENNGWARPADAGIDNAEKHGFPREPCSIDRQEVG